jgi:hypothetical protein
MWKEEVVASFEVLHRYLRGETKLNHDKTSVTITCLLGLNLNPGSPEYAARVGDCDVR